MKQSLLLKQRWKNLIDTILRFPFTVILLAAAAVTNAAVINHQAGETYYKLMITFLIGALSCSVCQLIFEHFFINNILRIILAGAAVILSAVYYLYIKNSEWDTETVIRTLVFVFIFIVAFLWVPSIKGRINFNQSFMAAFKAFFMAIFYNGVLFIGITLILGATDMLLISVSGDAYLHSANIIFLFVVPFYFLSLIPHYPGKYELQVSRITGSGAEHPEMKDGDVDQANNLVNAEKEAALVKQISPAKFLEALISYVVIPITAVFTIILLIYIIVNITGTFWTDNLMEPMLVSYTIVVIIVYLLASSINNIWTRTFRRIFPKVLVPVVLFQTVSSLLKIGEVGITYGRYYVILFGVFSTIAGILFCFKPVDKNGLIAPILIVLSVISILPVINAFSVSKANQIGRLENALKENHMLDTDRITPNPDIMGHDKQTIISSVIYLNRMNDTKDIPWLSEYRTTYDFEGVFGFALNEDAGKVSQYIGVSRDTHNPISVNGYNFMAHMNIYNEMTDEQKVSQDIGDNTYTLWLDNTSGNNQLLILEKDKTEINRFELNKIYDKLESENINGVVKTEEVTFTQDNSNAVMTVVVENANINIWETGQVKNAEIYVLIKIK